MQLVLPVSAQSSTSDLEKTKVSGIGETAGTIKRTIGYSPEELFGCCMYPSIDDNA
jgi:hypothetical protein